MRMIGEPKVKVTLVCRLFFSCACSLQKTTMAMRILSLSLSRGPKYLWWLVRGNNDLNSFKQLIFEHFTSITINAQLFALSRDLFIFSIVIVPPICWNKLEIWEYEQSLKWWTANDTNLRYCHLLVNYKNGRSSAKLCRPLLHDEDWMTAGWHCIIGWNWLVQGDVISGDVWFYWKKTMPDFKIKIQRHV